MGKNLNDVRTAKMKITHDKVDIAIRNLNKAGKPVNFHSVSVESGLSKTTLYANDDIRARIMALREDTVNVKKSSKLNDTGKDAIIESLKRKNHRLQEENRDLRKQLELAYKNYYEKI